MFPSRRITLGGGDVFRDEYSLEFDGTNDYVTIPLGFDVPDDEDWTVSGWFYLPVTDGGDVTNDGLWGFDGSHTLYRNNATDVKLYWGSSASAAVTITPDAWHHIVATRSDNTFSVYFDAGTPVSFTDTDDETNTDFILGGQGVGNYFRGKISEVAIYNAALSASQVATLYNGREPYNHKEGVANGNLVSWWRMGDGVLDDRITTGLVADQVNATLGSEEFTAFANGTSNSFDTFSASSTGFTAGADGSGAGAVVTNQLWTAEGGKTAKITFDIVINSGADAKLYWADAASGGSGITGVPIVKANITTGSHIIYSNIGGGASDSNDADYLEFYKSSGAESNITVSNFSVKIVSGNPGILVSFDGTDFKTDTP